jgi:hypothetical protein
MRPDGQAKPGVSDFMAEAGPTEAPACQGALGEEDDVWAVDNGRENTWSPVRACPGGCPTGRLPQPSESVIILCRLDHDR